MAKEAVIRSNDFGTITIQFDTPQKLKLTDVLDRYSLTVEGRAVMIGGERLTAAQLADKEIGPGDEVSIQAKSKMGS